MKKLYIVIAVLFLFVNCDKDTENEEISNAELKFIQFDVTVSSGEKSIGIIDNDNKSISLPNIKNPLEITSVTYEHSEDVSIITPTPNTRIGQWNITGKFRLHSVGTFKEYTVEITDYEEPVIPTYENRATIAPLEKFGRVTKHHMFDMNHNAGALGNISNAEKAFGEAKVNGLRVPLFCGDAFGGPLKKVN